MGQSKSIAKLTVIVLIASMGFSAASFDIMVPLYTMWVDLFQTDMETVKYTLTINAFVIAIMGLLYGPISDVFGRRPVLLMGLAVGVIGSLFVAQATTIYQVHFWRAVQGAGSGVSYVVVISIITDIFKSKERAKVLGWLSFVFPISIGLAPNMCSIILDFTNNSWQAVFYFTAIVMAAVVIYLFFFLPETLPKRIGAFDWRKYATGMKQILRSPLFHYNNIFSSLYIAGYLVFMNNSSFIYQTYFGLDIQLATIFISLPLAAQVLAAFYYQRVIGKRTLKEGLSKGIWMMLGSVSIAAITISPLVDYSQYNVVLSMMLYNAGIPFVMGVCTSHAVDALPSQSGLVSSLLSTSRSVFIGTCTALAAQVHDVTPQTPFVFVIGISSFLLTLYVFRNKLNGVSVADD